MSRNYERLLGIALTILAILLGHIIRTHIGVLYTAPYFVLLVYVANLSGLRVGIFAAIMFSLGAFLHWFDSDPYRVYWNTFAFLTVAVMVGGLKRKARIIDTLNGNVSMLQEIAFSLDWLIRYWPSLGDARRYHRVKAVHGMTVDFATLVIGSGKLSELIERSKKYEHNPIVTQELSFDDQDNETEDKTNQAL